MRVRRKGRRLFVDLGLGGHKVDKKAKDARDHGGQANGEGRLKK